MMANIDAFFFNMQKNHKVGWSYSTTNTAKEKSTNLSLKQWQQKKVYMNKTRVH
jgi:hypothetical protein